MFHFSRWAACGLIFSSSAWAHMCPNQSNLKKPYLNSHTGQALTALEVQRARANASGNANAANVMKVAGQNSNNNAMSDHDDPIIVERGSIRVGFGKIPQLSQTGNALTKHGCPMDHVVQLVTWEQQVVKQGKVYVRKATPSVVTQTLTYNATMPQTIKLWPERKIGNGFAAVANTNTPELKMTLTPPVPPDTTNASWKLEKQAGSGTFQPSGPRFQYVDTTAAVEDLRLGWIQVPGNQPILLRGACYVVQIYPVGADTMVEADGRPIKVADLNPPCKASMEEGTAGPHRKDEVGVRTDKLKKFD